MKKIIKAVLAVAIFYFFVEVVSRVIGGVLSIVNPFTAGAIFMVLFFFFKEEFGRFVDKLIDWVL